jgi:hypothetical protein
LLEVYIKTLFKKILRKNKKEVYVNLFGLKKIHLRLFFELALIKNTLKNYGIKPLRI